jgi:hypothetical protein
VTVHLIDQATPLILAIPFERGWMICHRISFKIRIIAEMPENSGTAVAVPEFSGKGSML